MDCAGPDPDEYEGMAQWNESSQQFDQISRWPSPSEKKISLSGAHTVQKLSPADSQDGYLYFAQSGVYARVAATASAVVNYSAYQSLGSDNQWASVHDLTSNPRDKIVTLSVDGQTVNIGSGPRTQLRFLMSQLYAAQAR